VHAAAGQATLLDPVDRLARAGFRMLLGVEPNIEVMDIRMPELDGLEATRRILAADDSARILILTTFDLDEYVYEALRVGASGFVLKDDPAEQLIAAVRTVAAGDALLSPAVTKRVIKQFVRSHHSTATRPLSTKGRPIRTRVPRCEPAPRCQ
jgi:DNA-binding NarL/FixJ family response regulator